MEKYITFNHIKKNDITSFTGLENEVLTYIYHSQKKVPLSIESFGITFPSPNFHIQRYDAKYFILEYIVSGKGYLKINGKLHELQANDVYLLEPGSSHEYYADKEEPFKKYWINFRSDVFFNIFNEYDLKHIYVFRDTDISEEMTKQIESLIGKVSAKMDEIGYSIANSVNDNVGKELAETRHLSEKQIEELNELRETLSSNTALFYNAVD